METKIRRTKRIVSAHAPEIVASYNNGSSLSQVAETWGISVNTVVACLDRAGVQRRPGGPRPAANGESMRARNARLLAAHKDEIIRAYPDERLDDIAARYDVGRDAITQMLRSNGIAIRPRGAFERLYGDANPAFKNGSFITTEGYRRVLLAPDDPMVSMADRKRYVLEHRLVMARLINRPLDANETVHHIDGDRLNNDPSNLQLRTGQHGNRIHVRCHDCGSQNVGPARI